MARRRYLVAYDIADPKRLRRIATIMESFGIRLQYSVFLCDLSVAERAEWESLIRKALHHWEDSVVWIGLGQLGNSAVVHVLGAPRRLPDPGPAVV